MVCDLASRGPPLHRARLMDTEPRTGGQWRARPLWIGGAVGRVGRRRWQAVGLSCHACPIRRSVRIGDRREVGGQSARAAPFLWPRAELLTCCRRPHPAARAFHEQFGFTYRREAAGWPRSWGVSNGVSRLSDLSAAPSRRRGVSTDPGVGYDRVRLQLNSAAAQSASRHNFILESP